MKFLPGILLYTFLVVSLCPTAKLFAANARVCETMCGSKEAKDTACKKKNKADGRCPIEMCKACQCCFCYFACPVENKKIEINVFESKLKTTSTHTAFAVSGFTKDCWQPPEFV